MATNISFSKSYDNKPYLYWWDVWDGRKEAIKRSGVLTLVQKDTKLKASISANELLPLLTEQRRTTRGRSMGGKGHWGLYVRPHRPWEIEIEAGKGSLATVVVEWEQAVSYQGPEPDVLAQEIADGLQTALDQFASIAEELRE